MKRAHEMAGSTHAVVRCKSNQISTRAGPHLRHANHSTAQHSTTGWQRPMPSAPTKPRGSTSSTTTRCCRAWGRVFSFGGWTGASRRGRGRAGGGAVVGATGDHAPRHLSMVLMLHKRTHASPRGTVQVAVDVCCSATGGSSAKCPPNAKQVQSLQSSPLHGVQHEPSTDNPSFI
jgi:hypothetical protein